MAVRRPILPAPLAHAAECIAACALALACAGGAAVSKAPPQARPEPAPLERPLAAFTGQRVAVLPAQRLRREDPLGWGARITSPRELLGSIDDEIALALGERRLKSNWTFARAVASTARRNPTYAPDPYALAINQIESAE